MKTELLVIGAQAAGMSAASRAKRQQKDLDVLVLEKSSYVSYGACGLPYYIGDLVKSMEGLVVHDAAFFKEKRGIPIWTRHEALQIDPKRKKVMARSLDEGKDKEIEYEKLVIGTGSQATVPPIEGIDYPHVYTLKTIEDGMRIKGFIEEEKPEQAVIIGAGLIGLEMAEAFAARGLKVTILKRPGSILKMLDESMTVPVQEELTKQGVELCLDAEIQKIKGDQKGVATVSCSGRDYPADMVLLATGMKPRSDLAQAAGLSIGPFKEIEVDERMQTSDPYIWAAGDCVGQVHRISQEKVYMPRGTTSNKQGRIAGENAVGGSDSFAGIMGTAVVKVFDLEVAATGLNEKAAQRAGFAFNSVEITHSSHAHTYPNPHPEPITVRLLVEKKTGRLLGAQMVGKMGVAKRIDVLAAALSASMTVFEISQLDLSYAPPYSPVYDAILIAANAAKKKV